MKQPDNHYYAIYCFTSSRMLFTVSLQQYIPLCPTNTAKNFSRKATLSVPYLYNAITQHFPKVVDKFLFWIYNKEVCFDKSFEFGIPTCIPTEFDPLWYLIRAFVVLKVLSNGNAWTYMFAWIFILIKCVNLNNDPDATLALSSYSYTN